MHSTDTAGTGIGVSLGYGGLVAVGATISGNLSIGGTLTYEDVTNVDSTGLITARNGLNVGQPTSVGATINPAGDLSVAGFATAGVGTFNSVVVGSAITLSSTGLDSLVSINAGGITTVAKLDTSGTLVEAFTSTTTAWSTTNDLNITNGNLHFTSGNLGGTTNTLDLYSTTGINTDLAVGQAINITGITSANATTAYVNAITIDGIANEVNWVGGTAPAAGGGSGFDTYTFNILKVGDATFHVIGNQVLTSAA
tara:strand:- start:3334 stop:4095 length:762 start_codon:yes stop_codon:yes gene_type:complete